MPEAKRVFSVAPGAPFLPTLVDALLAGRFGAIPGLGEDPLALAAVTILVPTRRAARALGDLFLERAERGLTVLPRIRPIGDVDEEEHLLAPSDEAAADRLALPMAVPRLERQLALTRLAIAWSRVVRQNAVTLQPEAARAIPASAGDAVRLAGDLARLIDEMATAGIEFEALAALAGDDYSQFWQITLDFLGIAAEHWPQYLAERGLADPAKRRDILIRAEAERLAASPPVAPIIAAGSTGSIPATALLLKTIASLPSGAVILPGLDRTLEDDGWRAVGRPGEDAAHSHPQFGMKQLIAAIGLDRDEVVEIGERPASLAGRARLLSDAMRPAETTEAWQSSEVPTAADDGLSLILARNEQEEALAIAIALREAVEHPGRRAALVTPDRLLAQRVAVELHRWGLVIDDSAGERLVDAPPAVFVRLLVQAAASPVDAVRLLALAKHPLAAFGMSRSDCRRAARALERALFRGGRAASGVAELPALLAAAKASAEDKTLPGPRSRRSLAERDWQAAARLAAALAETLGPLAAIGSRLTDARQITSGTIGALRRAGTDHSGSDDRLWAGRAGEALGELLADVAASPAGPIELRLTDYPAFLAALMEGISLSRPPTADPRIHIWGTLEARLQDVDLLILGGLDEGVWPAQTRSDPWLSRGMRRAIGLDPPERRIGLAAHDFTAALMTPTAILTRAEKRGGSPTVASRWVQRLGASLGESRMAALEARGRRYVAWARQLDRVDPKAVKSADRPAPAPTVAVRPRALSITQIETWIRDPYAIYARSVLRLRPLDAIGAPPDAATRGTLFHGILAEFTQTRAGLTGKDAEARFLAIARHALKPLEDFPETHILWWLRIEAIARWFTRWEASRDGGVQARHCEVEGKLEIDAPAGLFTLAGRADRIDRRIDGEIEIYDFKTGTPPSANQVLTGFAPQLGLEAAMLRAGAFGAEFAGADIAALAWLGLNNSGRREVVKSAIALNHSANDVAAVSLERFRNLVAAYDDPAQPYRSLERPMFEKRYVGDYDHLARLDEWRLATIDEDE